MNNVQGTQDIAFDDIVVKVRHLLLERLDCEVPSDDTNLIESGILDSLALAELLLALEETFDIMLDYETLEIDSLSTVNSVSQLVIDHQERA